MKKSIAQRGKEIKETMLSLQGEAKIEKAREIATELTTEYNLSANLMWLTQMNRYIKGLKREYFYENEPINPETTKEYIRICSLNNKSLDILLKTWSACNRLGATKAKVESRVENDTDELDKLLNGGFSDKKVKKTVGNDE